MKPENPVNGSLALLQISWSIFSMSGVFVAAVCLIIVSCIAAPVNYTKFRQTNQIIFIAFKVTDVV